MTCTCTPTCMFSISENTGLTKNNNKLTTVLLSGEREHVIT